MMWSNIYQTWGTLRLTFEPPLADSRCIHLLELPGQLGCQPSGVVNLSLVTGRVTIRLLTALLFTNERDGTAEGVAK